MAPGHPSHTRSKSGFSRDAVPPNTAARHESRRAERSPPCEADAPTGYSDTARQIL